MKNQNYIVKFKNRFEAPTTDRNGERLNKQKKNSFVNPNIFQEPTNRYDDSSNPFHTLDQEKRRESQKVAQNLPEIISDSLSNVTQTQITYLIELYKRDIFENGFNPYFAFRIISLYCFALNANSKNESESQSDNLSTFQEFTLGSRSSNKFIVQDEILRLFNYQLVAVTFDAKKSIPKIKLSNIQMCLDLLIIPEVKRLLTKPEKVLFYKSLKIHVLSSLVCFYRQSKQSKDRKAAIFTMKELSKSVLAATKKHSLGLEKGTSSSFQKYGRVSAIEIQSRVLDMLNACFETEMFHYWRCGKIFKALQFAEKMIESLSSSEITIKEQKYQQKLMYAYWYACKLHQKLHYVIYANKYAQIVLNILKRLDHGDIQLENYSGHKGRTISGKYAEFHKEVLQLIEGVII